VPKHKTPAGKLNLIREVLLNNGKTQGWLAGELDLELRTVNNYVNNRRQPSLDKLFEISRVLKELINS
jgi:transcriptional regulator with XRE-family HTH domain